VLVVQGGAFSTTDEHAFAGCMMTSDAFVLCNIFACNCIPIAIKVEAGRTRPATPIPQGIHERGGNPWISAGACSSL
jgi:hypothetical protein